MNRYNYEHDCPFEAFVINARMSKEGIKNVGEWIKFPITLKNCKEVLKRLNIKIVDGFSIPYEECYITDYDVYVEGLYDCLTNDEQSIDSLNNLASLIVCMDDCSYYSFCKELNDRNDINDYETVYELALTFKKTAI